MDAPTPSYVYRARVVRVVDGDTCVIALDLGVFVSVVKTVRLVGLDTPEKIGPTRVAGLAATQAALDWFAKAGVANPDTAWPLVAATELDKDDRYGRLLGIIYTKGDDTSLNQHLLTHGFAHPYDGGKRG